MQQVKLAIVGTSGRDKDDANKLEKKHMEWMKSMVECYISEILKINKDQVILVSGGSAWADHVAVQLYRDGGFAGLELYIPSGFNTKLHQYMNTYEGRLLNALHKQCQDKTGYPIFEELTSVNSKKKGVSIVIHRHFKPRNTLIAKNCDHIIAFTFNKTEPMGGGTLDTWNKVSHTNKIHFDLSSAV
jgi:hypothetical protein